MRCCCRKGLRRVTLTLEAQHSQFRDVHLASPPPSFSEPRSADALSAVSMPSLRLPQRRHGLVYVSDRQPAPPRTCCPPVAGTARCQKSGVITRHATRAHDTRNPQEGHNPGVAPARCSSGPRQGRTVLEQLHRSAGHGQRAGLCVCGRRQRFIHMTFSRPPRPTECLPRLAARRTTPYGCTDSHPWLKPCAAPVAHWSHPAPVLA